IILCAVAEVGAAQSDKYSRLEADITCNAPGRVFPELIKTDFNGDTLGVVIVTSSIDDLRFDGNIFGNVGEPQSLEDGNYAYTLFLTEGSTGLKIRSNEYHEANVKFPMPIAPARLWTINVTGVDAVKGEVADIDEQEYTQPVSINTDQFASLYIDEEIVPWINDPVYLEEGAHYVSARYGDERYDQKIYVRKKPLEVDARMGSSIIVKNGKDISLRPVQSAPTPERHVVGNNEKYTGLLGVYELQADPRALSIKTVKKRFEIGQRDSREFRIDEMVPYGMICYHGTHVQPFGVSVAVCKNFGWFFSYSTDAKTKINTPYGETEFSKFDPSSAQRETKIRNTSYTLSTGPMIRLVRKFYMQLGGGMVRYLSTSEPKILTADYKYKTGISANLEFQFRFKGFFIGTGYTHQFVSDAYNPDIANQISFTIGIAFGL
ncbi:MAG: hypothetical protein K2H98_09600, partial [Duncaniella sp.]|nr:hypothetical protein [Duncaniella sp.]